MKNEFFKFSSRRILFSTVMASALLAGSPQTVFAEVNGVQTVMQTGTVKGQVVGFTNYENTLYKNSTGKNYKMKIKRISNHSRRTL